MTTKTTTTAIENVDPGTTIRIGKTGQAILESVDTTYEDKTYYTIRRYIATRNTYSKSSSTYACKPGKPFEVIQ